MSLIFCAIGVPSVLANRSIVLSVACLILVIMAVNTLASCVLLMLSTYRRVRSTVLLSRRFNARYHTPRRKATFFASIRMVKGKREWAACLVPG